METINKLEDLNLFCKEALRIYTPTPGTVPRVAKDDHTIGNLKIKKGTWLSCNYGYNQWSPKYFENPRLFDPERWTKGEPAPFTYLPFSVG